MTTLESIKASEKPLHTGIDYNHVLSWFHQFLNPSTYFEIGTLFGGTLRGVAARTVAVDPRFQVSNDIIGSKPELHLFQKTSDDFFREHDLSGIFSKKVDLAFLDGMHRYEYLLRDFMNAEKHCENNSVIILHDCIPTDMYVARRNVDDLEEIYHDVRNPQWWAGDVWKMAMILKVSRPDLRIYAFDAPPTGLICITNLDQKSSVLADAYDDNIEKYGSVDLDAGRFEEFYRSLQILPTSELSTKESMARFFRPFSTAQ